ncbi:MAG: hypothetical protein ACD_7C00005G0003, partial [uncultured bacterium]
MKKIIIFILLIILIAGASYLYYKEGTLPVNSKNKITKIFVIKKGESVNNVAKNLENEGLIRNKIIFYLIIKKLGIESKIQAGDFRLSSSMDIYEIAKNLTKGTLDVWVTIIEGLRKEEIAHIFAKELNLPETEFLKIAQEGYLFPDTYLIPKNATLETVLSLLVKNYEKKYNQELKNQTQNKGLSINEVVILASMLEREAKFEKDKKIVASIILKRYKNNWPLQIDATVQYALGYQPIEKNWWKINLTKDDLEIDSPYNTYKNSGLPPTPISNPGLSSIKAVLEADENTPYWFYLSDMSG